MSKRDNSHRGKKGIVFSLAKADLKHEWILTTCLVMAIAAVLSPQDSFDLHIQDTLECGGGLCHPDVVDMVVRDAPDRIRDLIDLGVEFTREGGQLALGREGGHSAKRIVHSQDLTGQAIQNVLVKRALEHPNIQFFQNYMAVGLIHRQLDSHRVRHDQCSRCMASTMDCPAYFGARLH